MIVLAQAIGTASLLAFGAFLVGPPIGIVRLQLPPFAVLVWDGCLCILFFLQHSIMIRPSARARLEQAIPNHYFGAVYTIASGIPLLLLVLLWQESGNLIYDQPSVMRWIVRSLAFLALTGVFWSVIALRSFDSFGIRKIKEKFGVVAPRSMAISSKGPYGYSRHPIYLCAIVLFWTNPSLSIERILFNTLFTIWIVVATRLEERDLVNEFGQDYRDYQKKVPMLVPSMSVLFRR